MPTKTVKTDNTIKIFENKNHDVRIHICYDEDVTESPVTNDDPFKIAFVRNHKHFRSPNYQHIPSFEDLNLHLVKNADKEIQKEMKELFKKLEISDDVWLKNIIELLRKAGIIAFTVERHLHGNVRHYTQTIPKMPTKEQFDVSMAGLIFITKEDLDTLLGWKCHNITQGLLDEIQSKMNETLALHDQYLNGEVYEILISDCDETEFAGCSDFYGINTAIEDFEYMEEEPYWDFIQSELPEEALNPEDWEEI